MASWPDLDALKRMLGVDHDARDDLLQLALDAGIERVQKDVGAPVDEPSASLRAAALLAAVIIHKAPDAPFGVASTFDTGGIYVARYMPRYLELLKGHKVRFGVA